MQRIEVQGDAYLTTRLPDASEGNSLTDAAAAAVAASSAGSNGAPAALVWDVRMHAKLGVATVRLGDGLLDELLLAQLDAGAACAIHENVLTRLRQRGSISRFDQLGEALSVVARDPAARIVHIPGVTGELAAEALQPGRRKLKPAAQPSLISMIGLVRDGGASAERFVGMVADQQTSGALEILIAAAGLAKAEARALNETVERYKATPGGPRIRLFMLPGEMNEAMLANTAVTLASGEAVVLADTRCLPESSQTVQALAGWVMGAGILTASPRILDGSANLLAAGLTVAAREEDGALLRPWTSPALAELVRRTAAPAPWLFALNRKAWLASGGADPRADGLWTAHLARTGLPQAGSRHLLVGTASALWLDSRRPAAARAEARIASLSEEAGRAVRLVDAGASVARNLAPKAAVQPSSASFSDPFPSAAGLRLLVFADGYGASQSIAFVEGLREGRSAGRIAVRIVEEAAFGPDGPQFDVAHARALVREHVSQTQPTVVILSRFGHARAYEVIQETVAETNAQVVAHLDDDLFDLPVCVGIERYRVARHPWRIHTLHRTLADAQLVLAATDELADRLCSVTDVRKIAALHPGAASEPRPRGGAKDPHAPLIIGYMGSASHNHDLEMIVPALNAVVGRFDHVSIDLFGSIADQPAADLLRGRVRRLKPVAGDYWAFKRRLMELGWDIGLAPLRPIAYNRCKTPTKWAEYAEAGIATVVSDLGVYREMIDAEAAVPSRPIEWEGAISRLITAPQVRHDLVAAADRLLLQRFGWSRLETNLVHLLARLQQPGLAAE